MNFRREKDTTYLSNDNGVDEYRLDLVTADIPVDTDMVIVASQVTDLEDESSDLSQAYYRLSVPQADGSWKEVRGEDFTMRLQRDLQPKIEEGFRSTDGGRLCNMEEHFRYAHIPQHASRARHGEIITDIRERNKGRNQQ